MAGVKTVTKKSRNLLLEFSEESKKHLSADVMHNFIFNLKELSDDERKKVEQHIGECSRCNSQIREVESRKDFYLSVPSIFEI